MSAPARVLYVFRTRDEGLMRFPRSMRRPTDVVASAYSVGRWPHQLLGQRFSAAHLFYPVDDNALRLIKGCLMHTRGALHRPGLQAVLPRPQVTA